MSSQRKTFITISRHKIKRRLYQKHKLKMSNKVNDIDVKQCTCYFFNDIINVENFCPSIIKIDEKS